ncbi:MAG: Plug domain-containing protein, partial [Leptospiraceae bacterium]|nr:Plug domain-containing protein [Leptospiraceae bacterium]
MKSLLDSAPPARQAMKARLGGLCGYCVLCLYLILAGALRAESEERTVVVASFQSYESRTLPEIQTGIRENIRKYLTAHGFRVIFARSESLEGAMQEASLAGAGFVVAGYYREGKINLELFGQIYEPENQYVIDAVNVSDNLDRLGEIEGLGNLRLDEGELKESSQDRINEFARKISIRIRSNPQRQERRFNIDEYILGHPISDRLDFKIRADGGDRSEDVFQVLTEQNITVASNVARSVEKQPASVSVIDRRKIDLSGARTVNELLMTFVPGFFMVEDQDDVIAGFRGLAPDNNA